MIETGSFSYKSIFEKFYSPMVVLATRLTGDLREAEDIASQVFIKLLHKELKFQNTAAIYTYLMIATRNDCLNYLRNQKTRQYNLNRYAAQAPTSVYSIDMETADDWLRFITQVILPYLPTQERSVYYLLYIEGCKGREASQILNLQEATVRSIKSRARSRARAIWEKYNRLPSPSNKEHDPLQAFQRITEEEYHQWLTHLTTKIKMSRQKQP